LHLIGLLAYKICVKTFGLSLQVYVERAYRLDAMLNVDSLTFDPQENSLCPGRGELDFEKVRGRTVLRRAYAKAPLRLLMPRNHGDAAWVYTSNYGGGLVGGDHIDLRLRVRSSAKAVLLTQASTKVYRSGQEASQAVYGQIDSDASLVVIPDPVVCFAGSKFSQHQEFHLEERASLLLVDTLSSGRHALGERWLFDSLRNQIRVYRGDKLICLESLLLDSQTGSIAARMGRFNAFCLVMMFGPDFTDHGKELISSCEARKLQPHSQLVYAASQLATEGFIFRIAAVSTEELGVALRSTLHFLPNYLADNPWARKW
jgi:urease accessory protein